MKKIVLGVMVALCAFTMSQDIQALTKCADRTEDVVRQDNFYPVEVADMPQILRDAINNTYTGSMVKSVEVSNNSTFVKYKVVLVSSAGKELKVYFDDRGRVLKEHAYFE